MKKILTLYKQKREIILVALLILPCICMACGLKVTTHQLDPGAVSQGNYATVISPRSIKNWYQVLKLVSVDGKMVEESGAIDHYQVKPSIHTLVFEKPEYNNPYRHGNLRFNYANSYRLFSLYKKDVTFDAVPGGEYIIHPRSICVSEEEGGTKSLNFFAVQMEIKNLDSEKTVSNPIAGEFQPLITKKRSILHLYDGTELPDANLARLKLKSNISIISISGTSIDGTKITFHNNYFIPYRPSKTSLHIIKGCKSFEAFALLPGTYSIGFTQASSSMKGGYKSVTTTTTTRYKELALDAVAGNSYLIYYNATIKNLTEEENNK